MELYVSLPQVPLRVIHLSNSSLIPLCHVVVLQIATTRSGKTTPTSRSSSSNKVKSKIDVKGKGRADYDTPSTSLTEEEEFGDDSESDFQDVGYTKRSLFQTTVTNV
jgi:hypothetical protein